MDKACAELAGDPGRGHASACLGALDIENAGLLLDQVSLRAITPGLENVAAAAPVFFAHRDTWYGNPKAQINGWLSLQAVSPENSFRFYPEAFSQPVKNDSELFVAADFRARGGFGLTTQDPVSAYPRARRLYSMEQEADRDLQAQDAGRLPLVQEARDLAEELGLLGAPQAEPDQAEDLGGALAEALGVQSLDSETVGCARV